MKLESVVAAAVFLVSPLLTAAQDASPAAPASSNHTRLLFSPTGRPLGKGQGYFSDHYVVFPSVAYGLTDNLSIGAGMSVVPGMSLDEQLLYV